MSERCVSPLLAAAMNPRRLLGRRLEDGFEDGDVLLEDDRRDGEVSLQLVGALTELLRQVGHVLPLLDLVEELYQAAGRRQRGCIVTTNPSTTCSVTEAKATVSSRETSENQQVLSRTNRKRQFFIRNCTDSHIKCQKKKV